MTDLSDLGGGSGKRKSPLAKSAADQLAEATKPLFPESSLARALRETKSPLERGVKSVLDGLAGNSAFDKSVRDLASAQDRLKNAFAPSPIDKLLEKAPVDSVLSRTMEDIERVMHRSVIDDLPSITLPDLPPNPIFETNEHLEQAVRKIEALLNVQAKQVSLTDLLLKAYVEGGKAQTRLTILGLVIGFIGVVAAVIAIA